MNDCVWTRLTHKIRGLLSGPLKINSCATFKNTLLFGSFFTTAQLISNLTLLPSTSAFIAREKTAYGHHLPDVWVKAEDKSKALESPEGKPLERSQLVFKINIFYEMQTRLAKMWRWGGHRCENQPLSACRPSLGLVAAILTPIKASFSTICPNLALKAAISVQRFGRRAKRGVRVRRRAVEHGRGIRE